MNRCVTVYCDFETSDFLFHFTTAINAVVSIAFLKLEYIVSGAGNDGWAQLLIICDKCVLLVLSSPAEL